MMTKKPVQVQDEEEDKDKDKDSYEGDVIVTEQNVLPKLPAATPYGLPRNPIDGGTLPFEYSRRYKGLSQQTKAARTRRF